MTEDSPSPLVVMDAAATRRAWRQNTSPLWIELVTSESSAEKFGEVVSALNDDFAGNQLGFGQLNTRSPRGFVVQISDFEAEDQLDAWLTEFARRPGHAGTRMSTNRAAVPRVSEFCRPMSHSADRDEDSRTRFAGLPS
jgi:hypothetical protein